MKTPRLFYWEDAEDCWTPATEEMQIAASQTLPDLDEWEDGEVCELRFKRIDMTDEEFDSLPDA